MQHRSNREFSEFYRARFVGTNQPGLQCMGIGSEKIGEYFFSSYISLGPYEMHVGG